MLAALPRPTWQLRLATQGQFVPGAFRALHALPATVQIGSRAWLVEETHQVFTEATESPPTGFSVPLSIDIKAGRTWAGCKCVRLADARSCPEASFMGTWARYG